ncbi:guanine nucleotide binding protein, alpha subunit [Zopfochytrium polystomum]|nr:guanine nucleotide binding protein, alpha subunit [Zopfochytrium polystomum]
MPLSSSPPSVGGGCGCGGGGVLAEEQQLQRTAMSEEAARRNKEIERQIHEDALKRGTAPRILLLGTGDAGKSTIMKQLRLLYGNDYSRDERLQFRMALLDNLFTTARLLVASMQTLQIPYGNGDSGLGLSRDIHTDEEGAKELDRSATGAAPTVEGMEATTPADSVQHAAERIVAFTMPPALTPSEQQATPTFSTAPTTLAAPPEDIVDALEVLWRDPGVRTCAARGNEFGLMDSCEFLMTHCREICSASYIPPNDHIVRIRKVTTAVSETRLTMLGKPVLFYDVGGQKRFRTKWAPFFDDVTAIIFVASLSCYDQNLDEDSSINRMTDSLSAFGCICNHTLLQKIPVILFLNKTDVFGTKVKTSPIAKYFPDYTGGSSRSAGAKFFQNKFLAMARNPDKEINVHFTWATDTTQTRKILNEVFEAVFDANLRDLGVS